MKTQAELKAIARFVAEYATRLMGSGVHTSRVVRNTKPVSYTHLTLPTILRV